jgi:hypothetical protein
MTRQRIFLFFARLCPCLLLAGCLALPSPQERTERAGRLAAAAGWQPLHLDAGGFTLAAWAPPRPANAVETLTIYIEGDGLAWVTPSQPSPDPTPLRPLGLELALRHPEGTAVWLTRPCQYVEGAEARHCSAFYWTDGRFAPEVIAAAREAVDQLKQRFAAKRLALVGYSGGAAVAALVAARRDDVALLVTVAGNLDHRAWTRQHALTPLTASLNPADEWQALAAIRQFHLIGGKDRVIGPETLSAYLDRFPPRQRPPFKLIEAMDHDCCWAEQWAELATPLFLQLPD